MKEYICVDDRIDRQFIECCDSKFEERLALAATEVYTGDERIIGLTGPTCSGKTTASRMLSRMISKKGSEMKVISLDDFFKDVFSRDEIPSDNADGLDFDSPDTMDAELLEDFVTTLFSRGRAKKPVFDFKSGKREGYEEICVSEGDVFVFEGIQVLYPSISRILDGMNGRILFACPSSGIKIGDEEFEANEIRLLRRIVRDKNFRGASVGFTLSLWDSVRRNENANIFPNVRDNCVRIDTTLPYELHVLKPYLEKYFAEIQNDERYITYAADMLSRLKGVGGADRAWIGEDSIYKEFV